MGPEETLKVIRDRWVGVSVFPVRILVMNYRLYERLRSERLMSSVGFRLGRIRIG